MRYRVRFGKRWFLNVLVAVTLGLGFLISGGFGPVYAGTGSIAYSAAATVIGASCDTSSIGISWSFTATTNDFTADGNPQDAVDVVVYDYYTGELSAVHPYYGPILLAELPFGVNVGTTQHSAPTFNISLSGITHRPLTIALVDTRTIHTETFFGRVTPVGGLLGSFVIDPAAVIPSCSTLPVSSALPAVSTIHVDSATSSCAPLTQPDIHGSSSNRIGEFTFGRFTLTNLRTGNHTGQTNVPSLPGPYLLSHNATFESLADLVVPTDTQEGDTLRFLWEAVSYIGEPTISTTFDFQCETGQSPNQSVPLPRLPNTFFIPTQGCLQPVSVFVPKGPNGPDHYETQQIAASCQPINPNALANVAIYCQQGNLTAYAINNAIGFFAFSLSKDQLASVPADPKQNFLIKEALGARLYRLTNGNLQINRATSDPGKDYVFIWSGC
jgi:hypothetical protein